MTIVRKIACAVAIVLLGLSLTSCSSSSDSGSGSQGAKTNTAKATTDSSPSPSTAGDTNTDAAYCSTLKQARQDFSGFDFTSLSDAQFTKFRSRLQTIQDQAPASVADDWRLLGNKLDQIKNLLGKAGVSFNDLQKLQRNQIPAGFDLKKFKAIVPKLKKLANDPGIEQARNAIAHSAKTDCHISMQ